MSNLKKRILSFCLSIVFVLAALAVPLTTGAEETGHLCFELPNDCFHCADHDAADVCDESTEIRCVPPIIDPDCGCSSANAGTYTTNTNGSNRLYVANYALGCPHTEKHTSSNPDAGSSANNSTKGFYFDFVRKNGVGT